MLIYKQILKARARRWRSAPGAAVPTVCIGNVTVGGTGKTPHTELVLRMLRDRYRSIGAIASLCGWRTEGALRSAFLKRHGVSMSEWRAGNAGHA